MKRTLFLGLSALALSLVTTPAFATEIAAANTNLKSTNNIVTITPFNLVTRAYQGSFSDQGIPSNGLFLDAVNRGKVTAEDLVESAIANGRLAPETIDDTTYLASVNAQLRHINND